MCVHVGGDMCQRGVAFMTTCCVYAGCLCGRVLCSFDWGYVGWRLSLCTEPNRNRTLFPPCSVLCRPVLCHAVERGYHGQQIRPNKA